MSIEQENRDLVREARRTTKLKTRLAEMKVGGAIFVIGDVRNVQSNVSRFSCSQWPKPRFKTAFRELGGFVGCMVWRWD